MAVGAEAEEADAWEGGDSGRRGRGRQDGRGHQSEMKREPRSGGYAGRGRPPKRVTSDHSSRQSGTKGETKCTRWGLISVLHSTAALSPTTRIVQRHFIEGRRNVVVFMQAK
ncbi:hypothetical protein BKA70DRAFT_1227853 [Coprinopsis sp. MPI-PUGE-AT-0042]|nr:hypothetical protein BKA70DRAFT_1227853 [Coprinopsis sp. MPI-PUGE-AT-0042]